MRIKTFWSVVVLTVVCGRTAFADWKGWVHTHTRFSDGALYPRELAVRAKKAGVQFVLTLDHWPGIEREVKEINLKKVKVGPQYVGMQNYLRIWEQLTREVGVIFIPGVEYTFSRSHLGVVNITLDLHNRIIPIFQNRQLTDSVKIKKILELVRISHALPLICHPTLRMAHPKKGLKEFTVTNFSFDHQLWKDEPVVLLEFMNHGNVDKFDELVNYALSEGSPEDPSVIAVAGVDFHTSLAEIVGIHGNRLLRLPTQFPVAFERFTWIRTERTDCARESVMAELRGGATYLTYGSAKIEPGRIGRQYYEYGEEQSFNDEVAFSFLSMSKGVFETFMYRDDFVEPIRSWHDVYQSESEINGNIAIEESHESYSKPHRYIIVSPGHFMVGPLYRKPRDLSSGWKRVHMVPSIPTPSGARQVSIEVPADWQITYERRPRAMDHIMGYRGKIGLSEMRVMTDWKKNTKVLDEDVSQDYLAPEYEPINIIRTKLLQNGYTSKLIIDWTGIRKNGTGLSGPRSVRSIIFQWRGAPNDYILDIDGDLKLTNQQQEIFDKITESIQIKEYQME